MNSILLITEKKNDRIFFGREGGSVWLIRHKSTTNRYRYIVRTDRLKPITFNNKITNGTLSVTNIKDIRIERNEILGSELVRKYEIF